MIETKMCLKKAGEDLLDGSKVDINGGVVVVSPSKCLLDLKNSDNYEDKLVFLSLLDILEKCTEKRENVYVVSKKNETLENHKYILDNWSGFKGIFNLPIRLKRNQKLVSQVIKYIINQINSRYEFENPIEMIIKQQSYLYRDQLNQQKETKMTFTEIKL